MASPFQAQLTGMAGLVRALSTLKKRSVRNRIARGSLLKASTKPLALVKSTAPQESKLLSKAIGKKVSTKGDRVVVIIGARLNFKRMVSVKGRQRMRNPVRYDFLVERGTRAHGGHPGTPATHFLEAAFNSTKAHVEATVSAEVYARVQVEWLK